MEILSTVPATSISSDVKPSSLRHEQGAHHVLLCPERSSGLLDEPFQCRGWHPAPHFHSRASLLLTAGAVGSLSRPFVGGDKRSNCSKQEDEEQGQSSGANSSENTGEPVISQLQGLKGFYVSSRAKVHARTVVLWDRYQGDGTGTFQQCKRPKGVPDFSDSKVMCSWCPT